MKKTLCALGASIACLLFASTAQAGVTSILVGGAITKNIVTTISDQLNSTIAQAAVQGNFVVEKSARELQLLLANGDTVLKDNLDRSFDGLTAQQKLFLRNTAELTDRLGQVGGQAMALEQFAAMDLNSVLGHFPGFEANQFLLRQITGYSQVYQDKGVYRVKMVGQAFKSDRRMLVTIDGKPVKLQPFTTDYVATAEIPVELLAGRFSDTEVRRVPIKIQSWSRNSWLGALLKGPERKDLDYDSEMLLLPKRPVKYELVEQTTGKGWSAAVSTISNTALAAATGTSGRWLQYGVQVTIPPGAKMLPDRTRCWVQVGVAAGSWGYWVNCNQFTDSDANGPRTVAGTFAHQIHDQNRTLAIEASYVTPVSVSGVHPVKLADPITGSVQDSSLAFDSLYQAKFDDDYSTYFLRLTYFNGVVVTVGADTPNPAGLEVTPDITSTHRSVTVRVKNPYI